MRWVLACLALAACTRSHSADPPITSTAAPTAWVTTAPSSTPAPSSAPAANVPVSPSEPAIVGRELVDLGTMTSVRTLASDMVFAHALTSDAAYLWTKNELRAFDLATGASRWTKLVAECSLLAATRAGAFCGTSTGARWFRARDGVAATAGAATGVTSFATLGPRLLVIHTDKKIEAIDENGAVVGSTTAPFLPSSSYRASAQRVGGSRACGAQGSDAACNVFCVDATPRVVWTKRVPVPGGMLLQVDADDVVVSSDPWAKTPAGAVLRATDGATLFQANHRLAAALSTGGVFDAALSSDPVTLYDAKGAPRWTWTGAGSRLEAMSAMRHGSNVILALYSPIATGSQLIALDEATGNLAWQGNVDSLPIAHSKYWNEVDLRAASRTGAVLLLGHESSQDYAQTFDAATGQRLASILRKR